MTHAERHHLEALAHATTNAERNAILWAIRNDRNAYSDALDDDIALMEHLEDEA